MAMNTVDFPDEHGSHVRGVQPERIDAFVDTASAFEHAALAALGPVGVA
jgi:hypothetical protein